MADKNIFKLEGKSQEQVKEAFLEFLKIDKTKPGGYASVGSNKVICKVAKEACGGNSGLEIKKAEDATEVSKLLTGRIDEELDYGKRHQMTSLRCHVRKYIEFLNYCEGLKGKPVYEFDKDPDKPFIGASQFKKIVSLLKAKKNIILEGAPGVGKTFLARKIAYQLIGFVKDENIEMVQFHQSYSYEDFVQGIRPSEEGGFERRNGIFFDFCNKARRSPDQQFVFIIDEINRGNLSKIFGELLMLIEKGYRGKTLKLAYTGEDFTVPENIYVIGMMNTADRSLAMIDYALRRRFSFFEMEPGFLTDGFKQYQESLHDETFDQVIDAIVNLNNVIANDDSLGSGFCIGHSYFCDQETVSKEWLRNVVNYDIAPMLKEYWFDEPQKSKMQIDIIKNILS